MRVQYVTVDGKPTWPLMVTIDNHDEYRAIRYNLELGKDTWVLSRLRQPAEELIRLMDNAVNGMSEGKERL